MNQTDSNLKPDDLVEVLTFDLRRETFALEAGLVREILDLTDETEVPGAGAFVGAVINFRGKVIPVADLSFAFGLGRREATRDSRIVVVELDLDGDPTLIGLRADKVHEVATLSMSATEAAPRVGMRWRQDYVRCVGRRGGEPLIIPDLACIFAHRGDPGVSANHIHSLN